MNTLLVYMVNPQHIQHANAFILASNGRELSPDSGWWRIETELSFKHAFLQLVVLGGRSGILAHRRAGRKKTIVRLSIIQAIRAIQIRRHPGEAFQLWQKAGGFVDLRESIGIRLACRLGATSITC